MEWTAIKLVSVSFSKWARQPVAESAGTFLCVTVVAWVPGKAEIEAERPPLLPAWGRTATLEQLGHAGER